VKADDRAQLEARLEALERQNAQLMQVLSQQGLLDAPPMNGAGEPRLMPPAGEGSGPGSSPLAAPGAAAGAKPLAPAAVAPGDQPAAAPAKKPEEPPKKPTEDKKPPEDPLAMTAKWNHGLELSTKDKKFRVHVGGRTQFDTVFLESNGAAFLNTGSGQRDADSVNMRRGRLRVDGTMYEIIDFATEWDFVNELNFEPLVTPVLEGNTFPAPAPTDMWVNFKSVPIVGNVKLGQFKEPIGFDHLHSSRWLNFMERSFNQEAFNGPFNNGFSPGVMIWDTFADEYGTWSTGLFKNNTNIFAYGIGDGEYAWTSRVTGLVFYDECSKGANLLHVGMAGSIRDPNNGVVQYRSRGSLRNGAPGPLNPVYANTGAFVVETQDLIAAELSWQWESLQVNAEYEATFNINAIGNGISAPAGAPLGTTYFHGWYVEALYFLTGEHREYERKAGVYGRVIPHENLAWGQGFGAWQVGVRYSQLDLRDTGINGGFLQDVTLGLNWFLNPNMKLQANYVYMDRGPLGISPGGIIHGAGMRLAFDF